jgi:hypothetical protein
MWHFDMFVTLKVFKLIGPSNDGRRHGRGTYLLTLDKGNQAKKCDHDGVKKIVTILRKNVFSYVDIRPKNSNYLGFKKIVTTLVKKKFLAV